MGIEIQIKNDVAIFTVTGSLDFQEFMSVYRDFYEGKPTKFVIFDISSGSLENILSRHVDMVSEFLKYNFAKRPAGAKSALVVSGMSDFGMMRMFEIWNEIKEIELDSKIFYKLKDAFRWISEK